MVIDMPFTHDTYCHCIGLGMPDGLSGDEQHKWLLEFLKRNECAKEQLRSRYRECIEDCRDEVRELMDAMAFEWETAPETLRREAHAVARSALDDIERHLNRELKQ